MQTSMQQISPKNKVLDNPVAPIDPVWAWSAFEPSAKMPWDKRAVAHLFRRAGFGANWDTLEKFSKSSPQATVNHLLSYSENQQDFEAEANGLATSILAGGDPLDLSAAWVYRLLYTPNQLLEKSTLFWHGHFATSAQKVEDAQMMWNQNQLLRKYALGNFPDLVQGIAKDPAMLIYLDSASNRKSHPNENFARELMELFCLGEGNYNEKDVQELARCFTGWEIKIGRFRKNRFQQDQETKRVLSKSGKFDGEEAIAVVLDHPTMPYFICRKLVRYFVSDELQLNDQQLKPLVDTFENANHDTAALVRKILTCNLFYSKHSVARKIRSPVELLVGTLRCLDGRSNAVELATELKKLGHGLFYPPNVKGWDGGRAWINSATLLGRANLLEKTLNHENTKFGTSSDTSLAAYLDSYANKPHAVIEHLESLLLATKLTKTAKQQLETAFTKKLSKDDKFRQTLHTLATLPEYQLA